MRRLEENIINHAETATREVYATVPGDPVHPIEHTEGVARNTLQICQGDNIPILRPLVAAWLHDYGRPAEHLARQQNVRLPHAEESARQVPIILHPFRDKLGIGVIEEIQTAVAVHSRLNSPDDSLTARILKDADRLEGFGSVGLYRTIIATNGNRLCDPSNPFPDRRIKRGNEALPETTVVQTILYTLEWFAMLRMPTAIRIGITRVQTQIGFLERLTDELGLPKSLLERNEIIRGIKSVMQQTPS